MKKQALDSLVVSGLSAVSLATTVLLYRLVTRRFGPNDTDAFFLALGALNILIIPAYNAISSTLVPTLVRRNAQRPVEVPLLLGATLSWAAIASFAATLLVSTFAAAGIRLFVTGLPADTAHLVGRDVLILAPLVTLQAVGAVLAAASQAAGRYWAPAAAGVFQQGLTTMVIATGLPLPDVALLPMAFTLGALGYLLFLIGAWPWQNARIRMSLTVPSDLAASARLAVPLAYGTVALQVGLIGIRLFAARLAPGSVTAFDLAYRVATALVEVSASGVLAVALTQWSAAVVSGNTDSLRSRLRDTLALVLFVTLPLPITLHALRGPLVGLWLSPSAAAPAVAGLTVAALGILLIGVPLDIAGRLYVRVLIARERTGPLGWLSVQRMIATLILAAILVRRLGIGGLALSDTLSVAVTLAALHGVVTGTWRWGFELGWRTSFPRLMIASGVSWAAATVVAFMFKASADWVQLLLGVGAALGTYLLCARITRLPEFATVAMLLKRAQTLPPRPQAAAGGSLR